MATNPNYVGGNANTGKQNTLELPNPLHKYASYNVLFTLSSVTEDSIRTGRYLTDPSLTDVIARSSGIGPDGFTSSYRTNERNRVQSNLDNNPSIRTQLDVDAVNQEYGKYTDSIKILRYHHDLFIENVNMLSTISPNAERNMSNFTKMEFEIHEPFGITFIEKVRAATFLAGYNDYQDAPLLLTMEFRGFDENGKVLKGGTTETRKVPILIAKVDFDVNEGGARYNIIAVPYADMGFDDRFKVLRTRVELTSPSDNFPIWKRKMEEGLEKQMQNEIDEKVREYTDTYKFEVHPDLFTKAKNFAYSDSHVYSESTVKEELRKDLQLVKDVNPNEVDIGGADIGANPTRANNTTQYADSGTTVTKAFEDWLRNHPGFFDIAEDFWRAYLTMAGLGPFSEDTTTRFKQIQAILSNEKLVRDTLLEHQFLPWFKIKSTTFTDTSKQDGITKMHPKTITYRAIPYQIHVLKLLATGLSIGTINWSKFVRKNYDYIYTGDNVDVQGLRINYKTAYYMRNVRGDDKNENETGLNKIVKRAFNQVFGSETDPEPLLPLRSYPSNIKGRSTVENFKSNGNKSQEFFDYLTNPEADMMRIELDILGDPHYICQDVLAALKLKDAGGNGAIGKTVTTETVIKTRSDFDEEQFGCFNADQYMPLINLRYRLPTDPKENEGTMFNNGETQQDNVFFNGVYQVVRVDSKFDQGQFLQTLTCVRMNNQQGEGLAPQVISSTVKKYSKVKKDNGYNEKAEDLKKKKNYDKSLVEDLISGNLET